MVEQHSSWVVSEDCETLGPACAGIPGESSSSASTGPPERNEILSLVPDLSVMYHLELPGGDRGAVEFVGKKCYAADSYSTVPLPGAVSPFFSVPIP